MVLSYKGDRNRNMTDNSNQKCPGLGPTIGLNASVAAVYKNRIGCCSACVIVPSSFACGTPVGGIRKFRC